MRRHSVIALPGLNDPKSAINSLQKRRVSISGIPLGNENGKRKNSLPVSQFGLRRSPVPSNYRRASDAGPLTETALRASIAAMANTSRRIPLPVGCEQEFNDRTESEELHDEMGALISPSGNTKPMKGHRRLSVIDIAIYGEEKNEEKKAAEPSAAEKKEAFTNIVYDTLKTVFDLVLVNDEINVNIDNIFPLMKTLELDTKDEVILDMVRTSCMETLGDIDENEFDKAIIEQRRRTGEEEFEEDIKSAFSLIDADEDGYISSSDIYKLMMGLGDMVTDDELNDIVKVADADKDGQINYKDFKFFLLGETGDETTKEEQEQIEQNNEQTHEQSPEDNEHDREAVQMEQTDEMDDVKTEEELKKEREEIERQKERRKRSILWGYTAPVVAEKRDSFREDCDLSKKKEDETNVNKIHESAVKCELKEDSDVSNQINDVKSVNANNENDDNNDGDDDALETCDNDDDKNIDEKSDDDRSIISITVKQLDSLQEKTDGNSVHAHSRPSSHKTDQHSPPKQNIERKRPTSARPNSGLSSDVFTSDLGIDVSEGEIFKGDETFDEIESENVPSRCQSAEERVPSTENRFLPSEETEIDKQDDGISKSLRGGSRQSISSQTIYLGMHKKCLRPRSGHEYDTTHSYCEVGTEDLDKIDVKSVLEFSSNDSTPRTPRTVSRPMSSVITNRKPPLQRARSAGRLKTIKQIESQILLRQSTAPQLNREALRIANESMDWEKRAKNINGFTCAHIDIDLSLQNTGSPRATFFRPNSPPRLQNRRPKTATTFNEARRKAMTATATKPEVACTKYDSGIDSPDTDEDKNVTVVDLTKCFGKSTGYPENPEQSLHHHGYKSVWPLARVMDAYNKKHNDGKKIQLNSISRRLERRDIPLCWNEVDSPSRNIRPSSVQSAQRERSKTSTSIRPCTAADTRYTQYTTVEKADFRPGIINLQIPFQTNSRTRYKRISPFRNSSSQNVWYR